MDNSRTEYSNFIKHQVRSGRGVYDWATKEEIPADKYEGQFLNNLKHGIGKMVYASKNETYFGEFKNDKRQGEGMYTYANKDVYSGKWASGKKDGQGTYVCAKT